MGDMISPARDRGRAAPRRRRAATARAALDRATAAPVAARVVGPSPAAKTRWTHNRRGVGGRP